MRVVHITTVHHAEDPRIFWKECRTLSAAGFDVRLLAQGSSDDDREGVHIHALTEIEGRYRRVPLLVESYRKARQLDADLYHIHDPELIPIAWLLKRATGARVIYDMHEDYWWKGALEGPLIRALERWCFSWVDHVIVANQHEAVIPEASRISHSVVANYPIQKRKSRQPRTFPELPLCLVYSGVISRTRGMFFMMDIAAAIKENNLPCEIDLVGICNFEGQRRDAMRRYRSERLAPVMSEPNWDSYVPHAILSHHVERADVGMALLEPVDAHRRVLPTKLYEYLLAGLPVLISDAPGWREFIQEHECGAVVEYGNSDEVCRILQSWLDNPRKYERLSRNAVKASKQFRWQSEGERLVKIYQDLLA